MKYEQRSAEIFKDETVHIGVDVHSKSYVLRPLLGGKVLGRSVRMPAEPAVLLNWAERNYPGAELVFAYEAGFSGLSLSRYIQQAGHQCHVLHAADIPGGDKDRVYKNDKRDSRKIAYALVSPYTTYNYQISQAHEVLRQNVRGAIRLNRDLSRLQHRIRHYVYYLGLEMPQTPKGQDSWSKASRQDLSEQARSGGHLMLEMWIKQLEYSMEVKKSMWKAIDQMMKDSVLGKVYQLIQTAKGIGPTLAAVVVSEIVDMNRFRSANHLRSYAGLIPRENSSGDNIRKDRISRRGNPLLRWALIQLAWRMIDNDTEMALRFAKWKNSCSHEHKAIVKVANLILGRIRAMWLKQQPYSPPQAQNQTQPQN